MGGFAVATQDRSSFPENVSQQCKAPGVKTQQKPGGRLAPLTVLEQVYSIMVVCNGNTFTFYGFISYMAGLAIFVKRLSWVTRCLNCVIVHWLPYWPLLYVDQLLFSSEDGSKMVANWSSSRPITCNVIGHSRVVYTFCCMFVQSLSTMYFWEP